MATETISKDLADNLATKNFDVKYKNKRGQDSSAEDAVTFSFDWNGPSGKNYGTAVFVIADNNDLEFFFGDNLGRTIEDPEDKQAWYSFLEEMSNFATGHRYTWSPKDIKLLKHTLAGIAAIKEGLFEGYYGNRKVSYMGEQTSARLVIKHNRMLGENDKRYRYVESLFIETVDGERFKLPFTKLSGGRAMLEHVRQGGKPYDVRGCHIAEIVQEINLLARFNRASQNKIFEGSTQELVESAQHYYQELQENLKHLSSGRGYREYFESWSPADIGSEDALVEDIKTLFVEQTIDTRIESALPLLAKIQQGSAMKEVQMFESWISRMTEGTWTLPDTPEQEAKLQELMSAPLIAGADGTNATEQLYDLVGDDQLFDLIGAAAAANPDSNIWDNAEIVARLSELGVDTSALLTQQSTEQQPEPELQQPTVVEPQTQPTAPAPQPVAEGRVDEVSDIINQIISGDLDAYTVMTRPKNPEEQYVASIIEKEYEDVALDHRLHPDDDFEEILDRVVQRLADDYGGIDEADSPYFAETTVAGGIAPVATELEERDQWGQAPQDPMNYNGAITGSYYEGKQDPLDRIRQLSQLK